MTVSNKENQDLKLPRYKSTMHIKKEIIKEFCGVKGCMDQVFQISKLVKMIGSFLWPP